MIGIYNKGNTRTKGTFIENIKCIEPNLKVCRRVCALQEYKIAIAHVSKEGWDQLIENYSSCSNVRIRVTTGGDFPHEPPRTKDNGVYTFHLVQGAGSLEAADWKKILSGLSDKAIVKELVHGENPRGLRHFFVREVQGHLVALVTLCEGYLAVHADGDDYHEDISHALDLMRWSQFRDSDRGQKWTRQNLEKKIDIVRQPEWWLKVSKPKSFYKNVKKEWEARVGKEMPDALNRLLEAIRNSKTIELPKIVADAYCTLPEKRTITREPQWERQCTEFNHDWLEGEFLRNFNYFIAQLERSGSDLVRISEFVKKDFPESKSQLQRAQWIVESFENSMSPQEFLNSSPLNRCDSETKAWLGSLMHELWLSYYPVKSLTKQSQDALITVNKMSRKIDHGLEQSDSIEPTKLISLLPQFSKLRETYNVLSTTMSNLRGYESYAR